MSRLLSDSTRKDVVDLVANYHYEMRPQLWFSHTLFHNRAEALSDWELNQLKKKTYM